MKVLVVDGYNVIRATAPYREIAAEDLASAREALVSDVAAYSHGEWQTTIVFDGGGNPHSDGVPHHVLGMTVVFSKSGTTADSVVESLARNSREQGHQVEVVTSDAATQWTVFGGTVARRSSAEFSSELRAGEADWREANPSGRAASRLEERIDPQIRAVLERWARGGS